MANKFYYGGQAVVEGVMMRGQKTMVTAVRRNNGELVTDIRSLSGFYTGWMRKTPLLRGIVVLVEAMALGIRAMLFSANISLEDEDEGEQISGWLLWLIVGLALVFAVVLFFITPLFLTRLFNFTSALVFNLVDGLIRILFLVTYLKLMTLIPDIRRTFAYHGAEHTVVNAYENGVPIELETVKGFGKAHVRCGTSFLFVVMITSIIVFGLVGLPSIWWMVLSRVVLIPVISALSYEAIFFGARHTNNGIVKVLLAPGLWLQSLTTRVPDDSQLEVAITALQKVIEADEPEETAEETFKEEAGDTTSPPLKKGD